MTFFCSGIDYTTSKLSIREAVYLRRAEIIDFWRRNIPETAVLVTCNRIEVYGEVDSRLLLLNVLHFFKAEFGIFFKNAYLKEEKAAFGHALSLACGLRSQILGEAEIVEQLYSWINQEGFPENLKKVWQAALSLAESIREESGLNIKRNITQAVFEDLVAKDAQRPWEIVIVGTGKIAQIFAKEHNSRFRLHFASRKKLKRAKQLARYSGGQAVLLDDLGKMLLFVDAVISATASPHYVVKKEKTLEALEKVKKPFYFYDLAVPRDIEPSIAGIEGVVLKNLDDLEPVFRSYNQTLAWQVQRAEGLIKEALEDVRRSDGLPDKSRHTSQQACFSAS